MRVSVCVCVRVGEGEVRPQEAFLMMQLEICTATADPGEEECKTERWSPLMTSFPL